MLIDVIYTFARLPQDNITFPFVGVIANDKEEFLKFIRSGIEILDLKDGNIDRELANEKQKTLVKISVCVYQEGEQWISPSWYDDSNGKFYFDGENGNGTTEK